jgi:hypothetical protein
MPRHTPYVCLTQMVVRAEPGVVVEIPVIIRNLDECGLPPSRFALSPGWHPPNGKPWPAPSLTVRRISLRDRTTNAPITGVDLGPGEQRLAKLCVTIGAVADFGYITPVITMSRNGAKGGVQSVDFFEWEGSVVYAGTMTEEAASFFLYPTGPLR